MYICALSVCVCVCVCRYRQLKEKHELKSHEASLMASRVEQSTLHQQLSQLKALQESVGRSMSVGVSVHAFVCFMLFSGWGVAAYPLHLCAECGCHGLAHTYSTAQQEELIGKARETEKTAKARLAEIQQNMKVWFDIIYTFTCVHIYWGVI